MRREYRIPRLRRWVRNHSWFEFITLVSGLSAESRFALVLQSKSSASGRAVRKITEPAAVSAYFDSIGF